MGGRHWRSERGRTAAPPLVYRGHQSSRVENDNAALFSDKHHCFADNEEYAQGKFRSFAFPLPVLSWQLLVAPVNHRWRSKPTYFDFSAAVWLGETLPTTVGKFAKT